MFVARCPTCAAALDVDEADRGHAVVCPECRDKFVAQPRPMPPPKVAAKRVAVLRRWHDDSDYINETAIPPRHWIDREDDRGPSRGRDPTRMARSLLAVPANGLIWSGWIGFLLLIVGGFVMAIDAYFDLNTRFRGGDGPIIRLVVGATAATLGSMYFAMIATGAGHMKRVRRRGQSLVAAVMGLLTLLFCMLPSVIGAMTFRDGGPLLCLNVVLSFPPAGFGLWALVVLNRPEVIDAFNRRKQKS